MGNDRILILVDFYYPDSSANAVCVRHLQDSFLDLGIKTDIICYGKANQLLTNNKYGDVYTIKNSLKLDRNFSKDPISFFEKIHNFIIWPLKSLLAIKRFRKRIDELTKTRNYIALIATMRPIEAAIACSKYSNFILYELDSISNNSDNLYGIKKLIKYRAYNIEKYLYKRAGLVIHMRTHDVHYSANRYTKFQNKFFVADIPGLVVRNNSVNTKKNKTVITYTGSLNKTNRSPLYPIKLINEIGKRCPVELNFYSRGDCESIIEQYGASFVHNKGYVSSEKVLEIINESDFLLSIGNCFFGGVTSLPSKTIEYISTGKPIIHIDGGVDDTAKRYIEKCSNSIILSPDDGLTSNVQRLEAFIKSQKGKNENISYIKEIFYENIPSYTTDKILNFIGYKNNENNK